MCSVKPNFISAFKINVTILLLNDYKMLNVDLLRKKDTYFSCQFSNNVKEKDSAFD